MADITKCSVQDCQNADKCWRKLAKSNEYRQSYADFSKDCEYYEKMEKS